MINFAYFIQVLQCINVARCGFAVGLIWTSFTNGQCNIITCPLSTLFFGSLYAGIISMASEFVAEGLPSDFKWLVPLFLIVSAVYHLYDTVRRFYLYH